MQSQLARPETVSPDAHAHLGGATVHASPSNLTEYGRKLFAEDPHCAGSLGIAISEAIEDTVKTPGTKYSLGAC
ncbi:MAG TPA: hypothetical protein VIK53_15090 [Verrucomicrobiae bacterium]